MNQRHKVCLINCGGTITMRRDPALGTLVPPQFCFDFAQHIPEIKSVADTDSVFVTNIDSSNMLPELWVKIAREVFALYCLSGKWNLGTYR